MSGRHDRAVAAIAAYAERVRTDPAFAAAEADARRKWREGYDAYMSQDQHVGGCCCARCMADFLPVRAGEVG